MTLIDTSRRRLRIGCYVPAYNHQVNVSLVSMACMDAASMDQLGHEYRFWSAHSCDLIAMRNTALQKALDMGLDFLMMCDSDVFSSVPGGPLRMLLESALKTGATLTGALVSMRTNPPKANAWPVKVGEVYECDKIGSGLILLDLNRIRAWYDDYQGPFFQRAYTTDKAITAAVGSDIFACYVIREHGGTLVCDARIPTTHVNAVHRLDYDGATGLVDHDSTGASQADRADLAGSATEGAIARGDN